MAAVRIPRELAEMLGTSQDPTAFYRAACRKMTREMRELQNRAVARVGVTHHESRSAGDPRRKHRIDLRASTKDNADQIGLRFAILAFKVPGGAAALTDEARRMAMGLKRGLEGDVDEVDRALLPPMHPGAARFLEGDRLDGESQSFEPVTMAAIAAGIAAATPILLPLLAAAVPVLITLTPIVLPMLVDAANSLFQTIGLDVKLPGGSGPTAEEEAALVAAAAEAAARQKAEQTKKMAAVGVAVALLLVGVWYVRKRQGA